MSMYNPNCSIPKTLVRFLVEYVAQSEFPAGAVRDTLLSIVATMISPELLPVAASGEIEQSTEETIGPYELHDFFLFNTIRCGFGPEKILFLAGHAGFTQPYGRDLIARTLYTFYGRFFSQQFKRSCLPDGPKVGTVEPLPPRRLADAERRRPGGLAPLGRKMRNTDLPRRTPGRTKPKKTLTSPSTTIA